MIFDRYEWRWRVLLIQPSKDGDPKMVAGGSNPPENFGGSNRF
jgi:hypothetical protein